MEGTAKSTGSSHLVPDRPPPPDPTVSELTRKLDGLTYSFTQFKEQNALLYRNQTARQEMNDQLSQAVSDLRADFKKLREDHSQLETNYTKLREENAKLQKDHANLQKDHTQLKQLHTELKVYLKEFQADHSKLLTDQANLKTYQDTRKTEMESVQLSLQENHSNIQGKVAQLQEIQGKLITDQSNVRTELRSLQENQIQLHTIMDTLKDNRETLADDGEPPHDDTDLTKRRQLQDNQKTSDWGASGTEGQLMRAPPGRSLMNSAISALDTRLGKARQLFYAWGPNRKKTVRHKAMIFRKVVINEGGHYNRSEGVFIPPHAGLYFFTATVESDNRELSALAHIMVDDVEQCFIQGGYQGGSGCLMVRLKAGIEVWLMAASPVERFGSFFNISFSGTLVCPHQDRLLGV